MLIIKTSIVTDEYITNIINNPNLECEDCEEDSNKFKENLDEEERQGTWNRLSVMI